MNGKKIISLIILFLFIIISNAYPLKKVLITEVGLNNDLDSDDFVEIQNVGDEIVNLKNWAVGDLDGTDNSFASSDVTLKPGEVAIVHIAWPGTPEDDSTGKGSNYYYDLNAAITGLVNTKDDLVLATNGPASIADTIDALEYDDAIDGTPADDLATVVTAGQWGPDATEANQFIKAGSLIVRTNFVDSNTKNDWIDGAAVTPGATPFGYVIFKDEVYYGTNNYAVIILGDTDLSGPSQTVYVKSDTNPAGIPVTVYPNNSVWTGTFYFTTSPSATKLQVQNGDTIVTFYTDANDHDGNSLNDVKSNTAIWFAAIPPTISNQGADPSSLMVGNVTLFTAQVTDAGYGIGNVWIDLSPIGGNTNQAMFDDGSNGDKVASNGIYSFQYTVPPSASKGAYYLNVYATSGDNSTTNTASILLIISGPPGVFITEVGLNNNLNGMDFVEIQNVTSNNVNLNGWAISDLDGTDPAFVADDVILRPGEVAIVYNAAGTSEDNSTGRGSNYYWDFYCAAGGFSTTKDDVTLCNTNPVGNGEADKAVDALLYTDGSGPADDASAVVSASQWSPDASMANHFQKAGNLIYRKSFMDTDTKSDWADGAVVTPGATPFGYVFFDRTKYYGTNDAAIIILGDSELTGVSQTITVKSTTDTNGVSVTLYPNNSIWTGVVRFSTTASSPGIIQVSDADTITAVYVDTNDHDGNPNNNTKTWTAIWYITTPPTISSQQANPDLANNDGTESILFTAKVIDAGDGIGNVWIDLSSIDGSATQPLYDDGSNGDITPSDNIYSYQYTIPTTASKGPKTLKVYATSSNNSVTNTAEINILIGGIATHPVISEVATKLNNTYEQFVELYNPTPNPIDISGWKLTKKASTGTEDNLVSPFPAGTVIPAYGYLLIVSPEYATNTAYTVTGDVEYTTSKHISSLGKNTVLLYDSLGQIIDKLGMDGSADYETNPYIEANPPQGGSFERKAKETSTAATMTNGGIDANKGNGWDTDRNDQDFITRLVADPQNSSSPTETSGDKINITLTQVSASTNYPTYKNITVMAFFLENTSTSNIDTIKITNYGSMNATTDITNMSIWYDVNNDKFWDAGDSYISKAVYGSGFWNFTGLNVISGTNFVVTIDLGPLVTHNSYFRGGIPVNGVVGVDGTVNKTAVQNNEAQIALRVAPTINSLTTNIDNGTGAVTNNAQDTWDLTANIIENSNSGIVAIADLSSIGGGMKVMTNYGGNIYALSNETVPKTSSLGVKPIIVYAYDATTNLVTVKTTYITVIGEEPPVITNFNIDYPNIVKNSYTNYYAYGTTTIVSQITFTVSATDDGTITNGFTTFTNNGVTYTQYMPIISPTNQGTWQSQLTISTLNISPGQHTVFAYIIDSTTRIGITNRIINFIQNDIPVADAGQDKTVDGGSIVQLQGSGSDSIGGIVSYQWSVEASTVGSITLSDPNTANPTFKAPNMTGFVKFKLIVTDLYQDTSAPSFVTININKVIPSSLENAYPVNNPITADKDTLEIRDLPPQTEVSIYTITGNKIDDITVPEGETTVEWQIPEYLASGVYLVFIKDPDGNTKTLKIVVIR